MSKPLTRDQFVHGLMATSHLLEAAAHQIMTGQQATEPFSLARDVLDTLVKDGYEHLLPKE